MNNDNKSLLTALNLEGQQFFERCDWPCCASEGHYSAVLTAGIQQVHLLAGLGSNSAHLQDWARREWRGGGGAGRSTGDARRRRLWSPQRVPAAAAVASCCIVLCQQPPPLQVTAAIASGGVRSGIEAFEDKCMRHHLIDEAEDSTKK